MRALLAALILCALAIISVAIGAPMHSGDEIIIFGGGSGPPPPTGGLLLEDGVSLLLLENGTDHLCLESGC